jgi:hypothetical protein
MLGLELDPWQRHVVDVAGELGPDGLPVYRLVLLIVPRQAGKTTGVALPVAGERLLRPYPQVVGYGAQTGFDARNKFLDDLVPILEDSPLAPHLRVRRSAGNTAVRVARSWWRVMNTGRRAGRSQSIDVPIFDEGFALTRDTYGGVSATTITRPHHQQWLLSNAGDDEAVLLAELLGLARTFVDEDRRDTIALFEWAAHRDDDDADPAVWARVHPAVAAGRVSIDTLAARWAEDTSPAKRVFRREYLNIWPTDLVDAVLPAAAWQACLDPDVAPTHPLVLCIETGFDVDAAAIVAADPTGALEVIDHRPGRGWIVARAAELVARHEPIAVVVDPKGPAGTLTDQLQAAGVPVYPVVLDDVVAASARLRDDTIARQLRIRPHPAWAGVDQLRRRTFGDRWAIDRRGAADVTALVAAALAHHIAATAAVPAIY